MQLPTVQMCLNRKKKQTNVFAAYSRESSLYGGEIGSIILVYLISCVRLT